jgi:serine protease Do
MLIKPFYVGTCENKANSEQPIVFEPILETPFEPFLIQDPFGLRKAIVPVFKRDINGEIYGMGTAFHVDGWSTFLTADHVIDFARRYPSSASTWSEISQNPNGDHIVLLFGIGLIFGISAIPKEAFALVEYVASPMREKDNPLTNRTEPDNAVDIAVMMAVIQPKTSKVPQPHFVSVRSSSSCPSVGETVLAIGFPELKCQRLDEHEQKTLLNEGMYGAYGRITAIHPFGRSELHSTPVFEVECNWRSGMSGGPVFNSSGEVIGLVSRRMEFSSGNGIGWATCFELIPYFSEIVPTLDTLNPTCRRGWAVLRSAPWHLAGFFKTEVEAQQLANSMNADYQVKYGLNNFGTDDFIY